MNLPGRRIEHDVSHAGLTYDCRVRPLYTTTRAMAGPDLNVRSDSSHPVCYTSI